MPANIPSIFDMITVDAIGAYWETIESNRLPFLGEALFGTMKKAGLSLEWIKGKDDLPVALQPAAFDAKPLLRDRRGLGTERTKMPFFRESMRLGEEDRQQLLEFGASNANSPIAKSIVSRLYDDTASLITGAQQIPEIMRIKLLTDAAFTIATPSDSGQNVSYAYNYDPDGSWAASNTTTLTTGDRWSEYATSDPIKDIITLKRAAGRAGKQLTRMIIGYDTWLDLLSNKKITLALQPLYPASGVNLTDGAYKQYIEAMTGISITIYDKSYKDQEKTEQFFYPTRGNATLLTRGIVGDTYYGTTPEEADLLSGNTDAQVNIVYTGIASCLKKESLPVNIITWASEIVLPSYEGMDNVFNIKYVAD
jgi:hypothetical protein